MWLGEVNGNGQTWTLWRGRRCESARDYDQVCSHRWLAFSLFTLLWVDLPGRVCGLLGCRDKNWLVAVAGGNMERQRREGRGQVDAGQRTWSYHRRAIGTVCAHCAVFVDRDTLPHWHWDSAESTLSVVAIRVLCSNRADTSYGHLQRQLACSARQ